MHTLIPEEAEAGGSKTPKQKSNDKWKENKLVQSSVMEREVGKKRSLNLSLDTS